MSKITYTNKVALNINPDVADVNKCNATDLNEIKQVVNENDDDFNTLNTNVGNLTQLHTTDKTSIVNAINEVNQNDINKGTYSNTEKIVGKWTDNKPIYRKVITGTIISSSVSNETVLLEDNNIDIVTNISGTINYGTNNKSRHQLGAYANANFYSLIQWNADYHRLYFYGANNYVGKMVYCILEYTKITD